MQTTTTGGWKPAFSLNLDTSSQAIFAKTVKDFYDWSETQPALGSIDQPNGWYDVTPEMAEEFLRRTKHNRKAYLQTVRKYYLAMKKGDWKATGQALIIDKEGDAQDLQHRCWASYLGGVSFPSYVIYDAPAEAELFAYMDDGKPRNAADALQTHGANGMSNAIAGAIRLADRYDTGTLGIFKQPRLDPLSIREVLAYCKANPSLQEAAHFVSGNHQKAMDVLHYKAATVFFAWKVADQYGIPVLDDFLRAVSATKVELDEDHPVQALRVRIAADVDGDLKMAHLLALVIKAFNMHVAGQTVGRKGLFLRDNEKFPRVATPAAEAELPQAAE